jgi:hypothetical protein
MQRSVDQPALTHVALYLAGIVLGTASITLLFLGMRAVMDVGGACADGGPYVSAQPCPDGVGVAMFGGMLGLFGAAGLMLWFGSRLGARYAGLVFLGWPALFLSLGWNFLEYGMKAPDGGLEWGFLVPGIMFVVMGGGPLVGVLLALRGAASSRLANVSPWAAATVGLRSEAAATEARSEPDPGPMPTDDETQAPDLVGRLERLTALHEQGALDDAEFAAAKRLLLDEESDA